MTSTTTTEPEALAAVLDAVVASAQHDMARTQTDFLGRMEQSLCEYQGIFDDHPDGDLGAEVREDADEAILSLAGLALAQLLMLRGYDHRDAATLLAPATIGSHAGNGGRFDPLDPAARMLAGEGRPPLENDYDGIQSAQRRAGVAAGLRSLKLPDHRESPAPAEPVRLREEVIALRKSLRALLDACYQADGAEELPEQIDGTLLDAASEALELQYPVIWTEQQVAMLRGRQADGTMHPYTCGGDRADPAHLFHAEEAGDEAGLLYPTVRGWRCPACDYRQFWSHETGGPAALATPARTDDAGVGGDDLEMARDAAARYFENDPLDKARKAIAASIRQGGTMDYQDATQIALYGIRAARRAALSPAPDRVEVDETGEYLITLLGKAVRGEVIRDMAEAIGSFRQSIAALKPADATPSMAERKFQRGDHVEKTSGSNWRGMVVGEYSTALTPEGYAVESATETGSVQIYPAKALRLQSGEGKA